MASSAESISEIIAVEMAFLLSGRFSVRVASFPDMSRRSVSNIAAISLEVRAANSSRKRQPRRQGRAVQVILVHQRRMRILRANLVRHFERLRQPRRINSRIGARLSQRGKN